MLWDTHIHTYFSGDSKADPKAVCQSADAAGLDGICFTDHLDYDYPEEPELFLLDLPRYTKTIQDLKRTHENVLLGVEIGLQPHLAGVHQEITSSYPFDFIIGSSHVVHGMDPYYSNYYHGKNEDQAYLEYFESILENISAFQDFDVYGHLDYVVRYGPNKNLHYSYQKFQEILDEILKKIISMGKGIEVNTGGFRAGLLHPHPTEDILKRYRQLGGEILTLGSDAHAPVDVAYDFQRIPELLREAGFTHYTIFRQRKPEFLPLP